MKLFKLSISALAISLSLGAAMPAEANVFNLLLHKKHHAHQQNQQHHQSQNRHHSNGNYHSNRRVYRYGNRNHHQSNNHHRRRFSRGRVYNPRRSHGNWSRGRH